MKKAKINGASVFVVFCLIFSTISAVTFTNNTTALSGPPYGHIQIVKEVYDNGEWSQGPIVTNLGETLQFRITLTYHNDSGQPRLHYAYAIRVNDSLPDCLDYVIDSADPSLHNYGDDPNEYLYWDFGSAALFNHESLVIKYNATVVEPTLDVPQENNATVTWNEFCTGGTNIVSFDTLTITVGNEPAIDLIKEVKKPEDTEYVKSITSNYGETLCFKITVKNIGTMDLTGVIVKDVYPEFLTPNGEYFPTPISVDTLNRTITWDLDTIVAGDSVIILFNATVNIAGMLVTDKNIANVTCDQQLFDTDFVTITIGEEFIVDKKVWDSELGQWVEAIDFVKKCEPVRFRINITYYGTERMKCLVVKDTLPIECLNYSDNVYIEVGGKVVTPDDPDNYPDIYTTPGYVLVTCPETFIIQDGEIFFSWVNKSLWYGLEFGDSVIIEFDAEVIRYCEEEPPCVVQNCVEAWLWGCDCIHHYYGMDCVDITCASPGGEFNKTVSALEPTNWVKELHTVQGFTIKFKLELTYYGNENLTNVSFLDILPCCLEYLDTIEKPQNTIINVSSDKKTIWWHVNKSISDCETVIIIFTAKVVGSSECGGCTNFAHVFEYLACLGCIWDDTDTALVIAEANSPPCAPDVKGPAEGVIGTEYTFYITLKDPDNDQMQYKINWGDGIETDWFPLVSPGEVTKTHAYSMSGTFSVKAKAKDENGAEGEWTAYPWAIVIKNAKVELAFKMFNIGVVNAEVTNTGDAVISNLHYEFSITRDKILNFRDINVDGNGTIANLPLDAIEPIASESIGLRIGMANVTLTVTKTGVIPQTTITGRAFLIGPIVIVMQD